MLISNADEEELGDGGGREVFVWSRRQAGAPNNTMKGGDDRVSCGGAEEMEEDAEEGLKLIHKKGLLITYSL
jgi:hypothetical protein